MSAARSRPAWRLARQVARRIATGSGATLSAAALDQLAVRSFETITRRSASLTASGGGGVRTPFDEALDRALPDLDRLARAMWARGVIEEAREYASASASLNHRASRPISTSTKPRIGQQPAARSRTGRNAGVTS